MANRNTDGPTILIYTPPKSSEINRLLNNWENFANKNNSFFPLLKIAVCHYQFEAIHPFEDGNGRTGRILIIPQLMLDELLDYPVLFISDYLSKNESIYKKLLLNITKNGQWWEYIAFILKGFSDQAMKTKLSLLSLKEEKKYLLNKLYYIKKTNIRKTSIEKVVNHIFYFPLTHPQFMARKTKIHSQTCSKYLRELLKMKILKKEKSGRYTFYINLLALDSLRRLKKP